MSLSITVADTAQNVARRTLAVSVRR